MTSNETSYKLDELAKVAGVSVRTVRYYVQRGLLPAPVFRGRDTVYGRDHLVRLRGIKVLQERFLPLDAIQAELNRRSTQEIEKLIDAPPKARSTAPREYRFPGPHEPLDHPYRAPAAPRSPSTDGRAWTRVELTPGLELHLADDADDEARDLADEIKGLIRRRGDGGTR